MNVTICRSFNFDSLIEPITTVTYSTVASTQIADNRFSIIQNDVEPALVLKFTDSNSNPISFVPALNAPNYSLKCNMGFKTTLLNQMNLTTTQLISTYDPRFDTLCYISIDSERMLITGCHHNQVLNRSYLTVNRAVSPVQHYRNTMTRVVRSVPTVSFLDRSLGYVKVSWSSRDVSLIGLYELEVIFNRTVGGIRSKWTISPINVEIRQNYSLSA